MICVIGGGIAGMVAAYRLNQMGIPTTLLEAEPRLGGKVQTVRSGGFVVEVGPDAPVTYRPGAKELMAELGLETTGTIAHDPAAGIVSQGALHPIPKGLLVVVPSDLDAVAASGLLSPAGLARLAQEPAIPVGRQEDESFAQFVTRRLGPEYWEKLAAPLTGGIYGGDPGLLSTQAAFPALKSLEEEFGSIILGAQKTLTQRPAAREGGQLFITPRWGLQALIEALAARLSGVTVRLASPAIAINKVPGGYQVKTAQAELRAEAVIMAAPAYQAARLLAPLAPETQVLAEIPFGDVHTVSLAYQEELALPTGHGVLYAADEPGSVSGFTWSSQKWLGRAPTGFTLVRAFLRPGGSAATAQRDLEELLATPLPAPVQVWDFPLAQAMPHYTVGHGVRVQQAWQAVPAGIFLAGNSYHGVGLPEAITSGEAAAQAVGLYLEAQ